MPYFEIEKLDTNSESEKMMGNLKTTRKTINYSKMLLKGLNINLDSLNPADIKTKSSFFNKKFIYIYK